MSYLDETRDGVHAEIAGILTRAGLAPSRLAVGLAASSPRGGIARRLALVDEGVFGGVLLWEVSSLCRRAPVPCDPLARLTSR